MNSPEPQEPQQEAPEKKDALDEWVDELDRLIGIEPMTEEDMALQQQNTQKKKGFDPVVVIVAVILILIVVALLFYFRVI